MLISDKSLVETVLLGPVSHINHAPVSRCLLLSPMESLGEILK